MKKGVLLVLVVAMMTFVLTACGGDSEKGLVGTWVAEEDGVTMEFTFNSDATGSMKVPPMDVGFTYTNTETEFVLTIAAGDQKQEIKYTYSIDGDTLKMTDPSGQVGELTRK